MRKTYAYNSIIIGALIGVLVYTLTQSVALTALAGIGVSIVGFIIIRTIENALYKGARKLTDKIVQANERRKEEKAVQNGIYNPSNITRMPEEAQNAYADPAASFRPVGETEWR